MNYTLYCNIIATKKKKAYAILLHRQNKTILIRILESLYTNKFYFCARVPSLQREFHSRRKSPK